MSFISRGLTSHHTGTVPLCSTTGARSSIDRTSIAFLHVRRVGAYADAPVSVDQRGELAVGDVRAIQLTAGPLSAAAWAPFGWLPADDTDPADATHNYEFALDDPHVNVIAHEYDEVPHSDAGTRCEMFYRHDTHTQTVLILNVDAVIAVAPGALDFSQPEHLEAVRAFRLHPLDALTLFRGTWHWGPFPLGREAVKMFNVQGKRYAEDNTRVELAATAGAVFEVLS